MSELHHIGVLDIMRAYHQGLSPKELLDYLFERIERLNPDINCIVDTLPDLAYEAARESEARWQAARGGAGGSAGAGAGGSARERAGAAGEVRPLEGVPFLIKEQHDLAGYSATRGSQTRVGMIAQDDHPIVARLTAAGAIPMGRTTTPEFSCATFTQTKMWGITRNPYNVDKTPGGSSGGSAAAVTAGFAPFATASDIAGSTRVPAAFNGLPGFKSSYGTTPGVHPANNDWYRGDHVLARSVADTGYVFRQIAGVYPYDHTTVPNRGFPVRGGDESQWAGAGVGGATGEERPAAEGVRGMRIAVSVDLGAFDVDASVAAGVRRVASALEDAGAQVEFVDVGLSLADISRAATSHFGHIFAGNVARGAGDAFSKLEPYTQFMIERASAAAREISLVESLTLESQIQDQLARTMEGFDVLVTATSALEDLDAGDMYMGYVKRKGAGETSKAQVLAEANERADLDFYWDGHMTIPFNIANRCPVMAMPSGLGSAGVPTSVQIVGHPYDNEDVFKVAYAVEELVPRPVPERFW